jgi:putative radical SAM enzyme (TIGR03279 family)
MSLPRIVAVAPGSPAARAGLAPGDEVVAVDGRTPKDVLEWRLLVDEGDPQLEIRRGGLDTIVDVPKRAGEAFGAEVHSSVFDRVRTCDNHCEFCFIYQLPKGMRRSLYLKDDDYRLSFLYGNFTTLTRFTEADLERVIDEGLSPLNVSIHSTDPDVRARMLKNQRGATSLRWLRALLDEGVEVHGQVVVCPGVNDGDVLDATLAGILDEYPELSSLCVVPLGISAFNPEPSLRAHTLEEACAVVDLVESWQATYLSLLGRRLAYCADEYYLLADRPFPDADAYEGFTMHEDGIGMARLFQMELAGEVDVATGPQSGFFAWVDGAPAEGYRATRVSISLQSDAKTASQCSEIGVLTGELGAKVLEPLLRDRDGVRVIPVRNEFFGGTTSVTGLLTGADLARVLADQPEGDRYLLPDVCLSQGRFLDGTTPEDLPRPVEIVPTDGISLRKALASA